jgi:hypothetical protein
LNQSVIENIDLGFSFSLHGLLLPLGIHLEIHWKDDGPFIKTFEFVSLPVLAAGTGSIQNTKVD